MTSEPYISFLSSPQWVSRKGIKHITDVFAHAEQPIRFVGGAVRDTIRGVAVHDIDACTPATPDEVIALCHAAEIKTIPIGIDHGTVMAISHGEQIEITTLRNDEKTDGRHAEVRFTSSLEGDALRRDFTMNALMLSPDGTLTDYVGGMADIKAGIVRFIGEPAKRIEEDYLRILRYVRFIATTGWQHVDVQAVQACKDAINKLKTLSAERIQQEMMKLLAAPDPRYALSLLEDMGAAPFVFHCAALKAPYSTHPHALLRLALILRAQNVTPDKVALGWKLSKAHSQLLSTLVMAHSQPPLHLLQDYGADNASLMAHRAFAETRYDLKAFEAILKDWHPIDFPLSGQDVMDAGVTEGEKVGDILKQLKSEWKKSDYTLTRTELLKRLKTKD